MPASCCKAVVALCSQPAHPSNVCKGEVSAPAWPQAPPKGWGQADGRGKSKAHMILDHKLTAPGPSEALQSPGKSSSSWESRAPWHAPGAAHETCKPLKARSSP